jgi:hypothetical protein
LVGPVEVCRNANVRVDRLRERGIAAAWVADSPPDRYGRGDIYLVVPPDEWSRASEILENLDD